MRFEQLQYLEAALRTGSFRQAARELGVSQPTITNQVQRLEEDLGVVLVLRGAHGVRPTYAAERILPHAIAAIRAEHLLRQEASAIDGLKIGSVRLATVSTGSLTLLPDVVKRLHDEYPNIRFEVTEGGSDMVRHGVAAGYFDVGLLTRLGLDKEDKEDDEDRLHYIDLMTGWLVLAAPESHPLASKESLQVSDLAGEPLIFFKKGSILRRAFEKLVEGIEARVVYSTDSAETAQRMVRAGVGISIANTLAPSTVSGNGVVLLPLQVEWAQTRLAAVVRQGQLRSPVVQTFLNLLRKVPTK
ncbi:LysR family transcriptional regulator [Microtetraspora sp. NBRC 16547]|uniref:LysR family transcriptional regulator n=1 Tax=Microtetraspora sp. NBRC 16547 TaxID=3030993 RepID=UPI0024A34BB3|nr:LysR family transcriptional regulator [Microtetraspora sp. NBRC 16547]GLW99394.1 putative HTH-type transcriptional regulator YybE [Microtetraspora sp. NBRC 16547]